MYLKIKVKNGNGELLYTLLSVLYKHPYPFSPEDSRYTWWFGDKDGLVNASVIEPSGEEISLNKLKILSRWYTTGTEESQTY